jgi:hypothetical protein
VTKQEKLRQALATRLAAPEDTAAFLTAHAGLPGKRANLELAGAFADIAAEGTLPPGWLERLLHWSTISVTEAPTNHPREFLPFVAAQSLGALFPAQDEATRARIENALRQAANDPRWRMREACAFGLQRIGEVEPASLQTIVQGWMTQPSLRDLRAVLTALAHPPLLSSGSFATFALEIADAIMDATLAMSEERLRSDDGKSLQKALGFAPSVYVAEAPTDGFALLEAWADRGSIVAAKAVAANLRKARLARHFPDEVQEVGMRLEAAVFE